MISSFKTDDAFICFEGGGIRTPGSFSDIANSILHSLDAHGLDAIALSLSILIDGSGRYLIPLSEESSICFVWKDGNAYDVEITD